MDQPTATLIASLLTIAASGVVSSIVTYRLNKSKDQQVFIREKAELLYLATDEYQRHVAGYMTSYFPLVRGEIDWNEMLDIQIKHGDKAKENGGHETMTMLSEIYFPTTRDALKNIWETRSAFNKFTAELKASYKRNGTVENRFFHIKLTENAANFDLAIKSFKDQVVKAARQYSGIANNE